jgi:hypothetical protein
VARKARRRSYDSDVAAAVRSIPRHGLRAGDLVRVGTEEEILRTLDADGRLEGVPFMPEMLRFCGQEFRVRARAHKVCDTIEWQQFRRMDTAVHLAELRCDGSAHGDCEAGCLLFWKEAWLRRVESHDEDGSDLPSSVETSDASRTRPVVDVETLSQATQVGTNEAGQTLFSCQATEVLRATEGPVNWWEPRQYLEDLTSGNSTVRHVARAVLVGLFNRFQKLSARFLPRFCLIQGGKRYPFIKGTAPTGQTPGDALGLQPGEIVEIKSKEEISATLDGEDRTDGLSFDTEMLKYCGRRAKVLRRVERIIDEKTGRMLRIKRPTVILDGVICTGDYHRCCPRAVYPYWHEVWLTRVDDPAVRPENASPTSGSV